MAPDSLVDQARRCCGRNIRKLESIGALRVELVKPLFVKIENPDQLRALEINSPSVIGHTREAWIGILKRNIPNLESRVPENWQNVLFVDDKADRWHMIYKKLRKQVEKERAAQEANLAAQLRAEEKKPIAPVLSKPPGTVVQVGKNKYARAAAAYTTSLYKPGKPGGPSFFERVRATGRAKQAAKLSTPTHLLNKNRLVNGVTKAPAALVEELREKKALQAEHQEQLQLMTQQKQRAEREGKSLRPPPAMGSTSRIDGHERVAQKAKPPLHGGNYDFMKDREERLRALKAGKQAPLKPSEQELAKLTADFLEDDSNDDDEPELAQNQTKKYVTEDDEDLFDDRPRKKTKVQPEPVMRAEAPVQTQRRGNPKLILHTSSPMKTEQTKDLAPSMIIRKRKSPPTLFRPSKR